MRKRISERISETVLEIERARQARNTRPHRQERVTARLKRERDERAVNELERARKAELRERNEMFEAGCETTAGKKRQGRGRMIIATTEERIRYERVQRSAMSFSEFDANRRAQCELEREAREFANNFKIITNYNLN